MYLLSEIYPTRSLHPSIRIPHPPSPKPIPPMPLNPVRPALSLRRQEREPLLCTEVMKGAVVPQELLVRRLEEVVCPLLRQVFSATSTTEAFPLAGGLGKPSPPGKIWRSR